MADALSRRRHDEPAPPTLAACAVLEDLPTAPPRLLRSDFAPAIRAALPSDPILGPLAQEAQDAESRSVTHAGGTYVWRDGLLFRASARGDRLCVPDSPDLRRTVLEELHATPLGGHFGRDKTVALARRSVWWPSLQGDAAEFVRACPTCQRTKAEHGLPAGLTFPLPVPTRRGGAISLDFMELPTARSGHDFMQVHLDLLTGRVWLVPTFKTCTAQDAATNFIGSVFRELGLPDCIVSDRDTRFVADFWTSLHEALGTRLIFGTPHHHRTTSKVERVNGVVGDALRAFVNDRQDDWPTYIPLVEFAINDSASALGCGYTPFFADRGEHPRRPLTAPPAASGTAPALGQALARVMRHITGEVRALLQERQDERKRLRDGGRRAVEFAVGDEVLLDTTFAPLPSRGLLSARWMGPFKVAARCTAPNTYRLALPPTWRAHDEFNVERLRRYVGGPDWMRGDRPPRPRREVRQILKYQLRRGKPSCLVRWDGEDASRDTWEPVPNLLHFEDALRDFERATGLTIPRPAPDAGEPPPPPRAVPPRRFPHRARSPDRGRSSARGPPHPLLVAGLRVAARHRGQGLDPRPRLQPRGGLRAGDGRLRRYSPHPP